MINVNDKNFRHYSMPLHMPLYKQRRIGHRGDVVRLTMTVENPAVIANLVPEPLIYNDNKLVIDVNVIKALKDFPDDFDSWIELGLKIPVIFNGEPKIYLFEMYANNINILFIDREFFGMPRVPGHISSEINDKNFKFKLSEYTTNKDVFSIAFKPFKEHPAPQGPPPGGGKKKMPKLIWLKYIPSESLDYTPDVKKLVEIKYGAPPVVRNTIMGEGSIELLENAPAYLREAGIAKIDESMYHDMEFDVLGGNVLHNYI